MKLLSGTPKFKDLNFEKLVRRNLKKSEGEITSEDMANLHAINTDLHFLNAENPLEISDISGIEYCVNLRFLIINGYYQKQDSQRFVEINHSISDLNPLRELVCIEKLTLANCVIHDIYPLEKLVNLRELNLDKSPVSIIRPLANLINLHSVWLRETKITDLSPLTNLPNLRALDLASNGYRSIDLDAVSSIKTLNRLCLYDNEISDVTFLANLIYLKELYLNCNQISDVSPLRRLTNLEVLRLDNNNISDISELHHLLNLNDLSIQNNSITDYFPVNHVQKIYK